MLISISISVPRSLTLCLILWLFIKIYVQTSVRPSIHSFIHPSIHPSIHPHLSKHSILCVCVWQSSMYVCKLNIIKNSVKSLNVIQLFLCWNFFPFVFHSFFLYGEKTFPFMSGNLFPGKVSVKRNCTTWTNIYIN